MHYHILLKSLNFACKRENIISVRYPELYQYILDYNDCEMPFKQRVFNVINGIVDIPLCFRCNKPVNFFNNRYSIYCSNSCKNSDPDFMMKLWQAGVRYFKGVSKSRSYHFISRSVRRIKKNNGRKQFLRKWGISNSTFRKYYLHMGEPFKGYLEDPKRDFDFKLRLLRDRLKSFFPF